MEGKRLTSNLVEVVAAATTTALFTLTGTQRAIVRKIRVMNNQGANIMLQLGYDTLAAAWTPVMPDIMCLAGVDNVIPEAELPICGNTPQGFQIDTTLVTGFAGVIAVQSDAAGAAPNAVEVIIELELIGS